jgi:hypothetical protein
MQLYELYFATAYECITGTVGERLVQVPSTRVVEETNPTPLTLGSYLVPPLSRRIRFLRIDKVHSRNRSVIFSRNRVTPVEIGQKQKVDFNTGSTPIAELVLSSLEF